MSMSDSDSSSYGGDYKNFKQISRERELYKTSLKGDWNLLAMEQRKLQD